MNPTEAAKLLSVASTACRTVPKPDADVAKGWAAILRDITLDEALDAATDSIRATGDVTPHLILERVRARRQDAAMRDAAAERSAAREALTSSVARAIERGVPLGDPSHVGEQHLDAIYEQHGWSPTARAAARYKCPAGTCRAEVGRACTRASARETDGRIVRKEPHPSRVALTVTCPDVDCGAEPGVKCGDEHPHHARDLLAIGDAGRRRRKAVTADLRKTSADADWNREVDFTSPDPEHEPPPDPRELPAPRDADDVWADA